MPFRYRLILIIFFTLIFVTLTPALILYGQGYRYDFRNRRLTKTGNFFIKSIPPGARVIINNQPLTPKWYRQLLFYKKFLGLIKIQDTTPTVIPNLLPDNYQITVYKPGYYSWQKKLEIRAEKTTETNKIFLFLKQPGLKLLIKEKIDFIYPLTKDKNLIYSIYDPSSQNSQIKLISLTEIFQDHLATVSGRILKIEEAGPYFIIYTSKSKIFIINSSTPQIIINLNNFFKNPNKVVYDENLFYVQSADIIYSFNPKTKQIKLVLNLKFKNFIIQDWLVKENNWFLLGSTPNGICLKKTKLNQVLGNLESESTYLNLPAYQFKFYPLSIDNNLIILKAAQDLFIIDLNQKNNPIILKNQANEILTQPGDKKMLYYNDFEIILANITQNPEGQPKIIEELINRSGQILNQVIWHPDNTYLIFVSKDEIWAMEIDGSGTRNIYKLLTGNKIKKIWFRENPRYLYIWGEINDQEGIWQAQIH
ncbi:MAG: PEGA domain-containing protein [Patescibacteria group bacterium]